MTALERISATIPFTIRMLPGCSRSNSPSRGETRMRSERHQPAIRPERARKNCRHALRAFRGATRFALIGLSNWRAHPSGKETARGVCLLLWLMHAAFQIFELTLDFLFPFLVGKLPF